MKVPGRIREVSELTGDASTRRYFRVTLEGDTAVQGGPVTMIMMRYPPSHVVDGELAFLNVHRYLLKAGIPVPRIYLHLPEARLLFLEDGGDTTLEDVVEKSGFCQMTDALYNQAIDQIVAIQVRGTKSLDPKALPSRYAFDHEKLMWEMDFFATWGLEKRHSNRGREKVKTHFLKLLEPVIDHITALPLLLVHRDYHSRNIMVWDDRSIRIIDFQDARMGNMYYDPASLLFDSYVEMPPEEREKLVSRYSEQVKDEPFSTSSSREETEENLYTMAIQRNLKALGTFFSMYYGKGNDRYLKYIPPTIGHLRNNPFLKGKYRDLSAFIFPLLLELQDQINPKGGCSNEGYDPRGGTGHQTPTSDI